MRKYAYLIILFLFISSIKISAQWFAQQSGTNDLLYGIQFVDANNGWVTNLNGTKLFHTTNGGNDWFVQKDFGTGVIWFLTFINDSIGYVCSHGGPAHLLKSTDEGSTWQLIHTFSSTVDVLKFENENTGWCVETELLGYLSKTTNGGLDWEPVDYFNSIAGYFGRIGIIDQNSVIFPFEEFTGETSFYKTKNGGATWTQIPNPNAISGRIQFVNSNTGWIESDFDLYKTTDGGFNWQMQVSSVYDFFFVNENFGWYINSNQIFKSTDGGESWISQNSGTNNSLHSVFFIDQNNGWVSGDLGTILYTPNGGTPVELISFNAIVSGSDIQLDWKTVTETNNKGFQVERKIFSLHSTMGNDWTSIGFINGQGTTADSKIYSFTDKSLQPGKYSYRLKQIDFDGTYEYSKVIEAEVAPTTFSLSQNYPNPFNPTTTIRYTIGEAGNSKINFVKLNIYDVLGNEVATLVNKEQPAGNYSIEFDGSNLASGIYFYQLKVGSYSATKKLILLK